MLYNFFYRNLVNIVTYLNWPDYRLEAMHSKGERLVWVSISFLFLFPKSCSLIFSAWPDDKICFSARKGMLLLEQVWVCNFAPSRLLHEFYVYLHTCYGSGWGICFTSNTLKKYIIMWLRPGPNVTQWASRPTQKLPKYILFQMGSTRRERDV